MSITNPNRRSGETITGRWQLDPHRSSVEFSTRNLWGLQTVRGHFEDYRGRLDLSADSAIEVTIEAASVHTGNHTRDQHLRSPAFFDTENHPQVQFRSDSVDLRGDTLKVRGRLAAGGHSIPIELDAQIHQAADGLEIEAATTAPHRELGMRYGSRLGMISARSELLVKGYLIPDTEAD